MLQHDHYQQVDLAVGEAEGYFPEIGDELIQRGCEFVGWLAFKRGQHREVSAVLTSPDGLAFVFPLWVFDSPQVSLKTLLEDGMVVETATMPKRFIMPLIRGKLHHPRAGHHVQAEAPLIDVMLAKHQAKIAELCERRATRVRPHDNTRLAAVIQNRLARVRLVRLLVAIGIAPFLILALQLPAALLAPGWIGLVVSFAIAVLCLTWWSAEIARRLPFPRIRSAADLAGPAPERDREDRLLQ